VLPHGRAFLIRCYFCILFYIPAFSNTFIFNGFQGYYEMNQLLETWGEKYLTVRAVYSITYLRSFAVQNMLTEVPK
jgi:hypothetical protein